MKANQTDKRLETTLAAITLRNPVLTASGTCGYGPELADLLDYRRLGGFVTKSVTRQPRPGNEPERIVEVEGGLLNAIGLANVGLDTFLAEKLPYIQQMPTAVIVNVAGHTIDDYVAVCAAIDGQPGAAGIELNVSCPNVADGLVFGTDADRLRELVAAVRPVVRPGRLIVKLSPNVTDIAALGRAAVDGGADVLSMINTCVGLSVDIERRRPRLARGSGGLSGPAIRPIALHAVRRVYVELARAAGVPIIGMGGVCTAEDAIAFLLAGASAVAVGTALFVAPTAPVDIAEGIGAYLTRHGFDHVRDVVGQLETGA